MPALSAGRADVRVFVVHLERSTDRRAFMEQQFAAAGLRDIEWVPAVDWRAPDYRPRCGLSLVREDVLIEHNWDGRKYVRAEDAVFQSHIKTLEAFIASGLPYGLILEDDAELAPGFAEVISRVIEHRAQWDMVCLEGFRPWGGRPAIHVAALGKSTLVASLNPCAGSAAYLVSQAAARTLVEQAPRVLEPIDNYLNATWRHGLRLLDVSPFPARQGALVSMRHVERGPYWRAPIGAFNDWQRHIRADFVGRYLRRWARQLALYGFTRVTIARWSRDWQP